MPESVARTMIVTGASSGIGRALALGAARAGFRLVIVARRAERLAELAASIQADGGACVTVVTDVRASDAPSRIVDAAMSAFARIDVVVNDAGAGAYGSLLEQTDEEIDAQWQLHVAAPLRIARAALTHVERTHGQLVFFGSGLARVPLPKYGAYAPAKAAIRAAATQLRRELRDRGVAVTYVDPGYVATEFHEAMGVERSTEVKPVSPERVAVAVLRGIEHRRAVVNAVPWQTAGSILGEWCATLADPSISRMTPRPVQSAPAKPQASTAAPPPDIAAAPKAATTPQAPGEVERGDAGDFDAALEPVARRMERVKLSPTFVREALVPGATVELNEIAMRWAGMPNKNERAAMREVLDTLAVAGYLETAGEETWKVVRAAD